LRRPEAYHARLREATGKPATGAVASIHEQTRVKEPGLERYLRYDRWPRHAFRTLIFDPSRTHADYENLELREDPGFAGGSFTVKSSSPTDAELFRADSLALNHKMEGAAPKLLLVKKFTFGAAPVGCEVACEINLKVKAPLERPIALGIESVINLLAPTEPDRFFETSKGRMNMRFSGSLPASILRMEDGWQRIRVAVHAPHAEQFWIAPIETVSESEEGFERVYQGSQILAVWRLPLTKQKTWSARLVWRLEAF
jgi:4-alpha-glucanotransferase